MKFEDKNKIIYEIWCSIAFGINCNIFALFASIKVNQMIFFYISLPFTVLLVLCTKLDIDGFMIFKRGSLIFQVVVSYIGLFVFSIIMVYYLFKLSLIIGAIIIIVSILIEALITLILVYRYRIKRFLKSKFKSK